MPVHPLQMDVEEKLVSEIAETESMAYISHSAKWNHLLKHPVISSYEWRRLSWFFYTNFVVCHRNKKLSYFYFNFCSALGVSSCINSAGMF